MRIANALFAALFLFSVVVQYNDPDPLEWMAIYGAALAACVGWERRKMPRRVIAVIAVIALFWCVFSALGVHLTAPFRDAVTDWKMHAGGSEELRETMGLGLVVIWMAVLFNVERTASPMA